MKQNEPINYYLKPRPVGRVSNIIEGLKEKVEAKELFSDQTQTIDDCQCVYCGHKFDGRDACNANMDCDMVTCPKCGKEMNVFVSIEYTCMPIEDE